MKNITIGIVSLLVAGAIVGAYFFPSSISKTIVQQLAGSAVGTTFNTAKVAAVNVNFSNGTASSTSILNTDSSGRWYYQGFANCTNLEAASSSVSSFNIVAATTSVANLGLQGNTNYLMNINLATSSAYISAFSNNATTTRSDTASQGYWPSNTYLTFLTNTVSTTSACTVGVYYIAS